jgi:Carbohydrate binding domain
MSHREIDIVRKRLDINANKFLIQKTMQKLASTVVIMGLCAAMLGGVEQVKANLVVNGGFETGDFTGWTTGPNSYPMYIVTSPVNSGSYAAQIAGYSSFPDTLIQQTIPTTLGQNYTLSFWREVDGGGPTISLDVKWNGSAIFSELNTGAQPYQQFSFTVQGTGSDTIEFICANDPSFTYLDDVSLTPVPEPSTVIAGALLLLPFGFSTIRHFRSRKQAA